MLQYQYNGGETLKLTQQSWGGGGTTGGKQGFREGGDKVGENNKNE